MRKLLKTAAALAGLLILCCLFVFPAAAEGPETETARVEDSELYRHIYQEIVSLSEEIDLSAYNATKEDVQAVYQVIHRRPELFYTDSTYRIKLRSGNVVSVIPGYTMTGETLIEAQHVYTDTLDAILACVDPAWTDFEKVLYLHDYLVTQYAYDEELGSYEVYSFFAKGKGVCQAYSYTMCALLEALGIPVSYAVSLPMDHMWNLVCLDGEWYHLDVTWDDPMPDRTGYVSRTYFLCSDEKMKTLEHYGWEAAYACTDTRYDGSFFGTVSTPVVPWGDLWYYIDKTDGALCAWNGDPSAAGKIITRTGTFTEPWRTGAESNGWYFSGLVRAGDVLLFNSSRQILAYHPVSGLTEALRTEQNEDEVLCGITAKPVPARFTSTGDRVTYCVRKDDKTGDMRICTVTPKNSVTCSVAGKVTGYFASCSVRVSLYANGQPVKQQLLPRGTGSREGSLPFMLSGVRPGVYELRIEADGCFPVRISGFRVDHDTVLDTEPSLTFDRDLLVLRSGDLTGDGVIDEGDRAVLCAYSTFNRSAQKAAEPKADLNGDGFVDFLDLAILTSPVRYGVTAASRIIPAA